MANKRDTEKRKYEYTNPSERAETHGTAGGATMIARPEGMEFFSYKEAKVYKLDVLPYIVKRGKDKSGGNPYAKTGALHYERTFFAHYKVGPGNKSVVCPSMTWGKPCPICEERNRLERERSQDKAVKALIYSMRPKERQLFYLYDRTSQGEEAKGVKLWEVAFHNFGKLLDKRIRMAVDENKEQFQSFHSLDEGSRLLVTISEMPMQDGGTYMGASIIDFVKRKTALPDSLLDDLAPLEDLLVEILYEKLKNMHEGIEEDDDKPADEDAPPARGGSSRSTRTVDDDDDTPPARPASRRDTPVESTDDDDGKGGTDDDDDTPEPPKPAPKPSGKKPAAKPPVEEEAPAPTGKKGGKSTKFEVGDKVIYDDERCTIVKVYADGEKFHVKDGDGTIHKEVETLEIRLAPPKKTTPADDE